MSIVQAKIMFDMNKDWQFQFQAFDWIIGIHIQEQ